MNRLCTQVADRYGWGFANINLRCYYAEGAKTMGFEIVEQLGWRYPAARRLAGRRRHAAAAHRHAGSASCGEIGLVDGELPRIHAAQAAGCAPVVRALEEGLEFPDPVKPNTIAKSIAIGNPADGFQVIETVKSTGGSGATVDRRGDPRGDASCSPRPKASSPSRPAARRLPARSRSCAAA